MITALLFVIIIVLGIYAGAAFSESERFALNKRSSWFDRKPFNCRPCLTFHLLWIQFTIAAIILGSWEFFFTGLVSSIAIFGMLYLDNKHKITK